MQDFIDMYVSREHRDGRATGCTMAALCGDAARQSGDLKSAFADGIERTLQTLGDKYPHAADAPAGEGRTRMIDLLARAVARSCSRGRARTTQRWPMKSSRCVTPK